MAFADLYDDMDLAEDMIKYVHLPACWPNARRGDGLPRPALWTKGLIDRLNAIVSSEFAPLYLHRGHRHPAKERPELRIPRKSWGMDLQTEHERYLSEKALQAARCSSTTTPRRSRPSTCGMNDDGKTVAADGPAGARRRASSSAAASSEERSGRAQRRASQELRHARGGLLLLPRHPRAYGTTPHAGFGLGFERLVMYLTGMQNIRDVLPFPRTTGSAEY